MRNATFAAGPAAGYVLDAGYVLGPQAGIGSQAGIGARTSGNDAAHDGSTPDTAERRTATSLGLIDGG